MLGQNRANWAVASVISLSFVVTSPAVLAQDPEESAREAAEREFGGANARSAEIAGADGPAITFEQTLNAPDDVQLNLAYARQQIAAGDLKEGSAAIERILLINPELHEVRVLYGLVLYRLGLLDRARFELEKAIESGALSPTVLAEADAYLQRIKYEQRRTRGSLTITAGAEWDSNRNQSPSSGQLLFFDVPLAADPARDDFAIITSVQGRIVHDLDGQDGNSIHAEAGYYRSDKTKVDRLDLDAVNLAVGGTWNFGRLSVTPRLRGGQFWLNGENYLRTLGGEVNFLMRWRPDLRTHLNLRGEDEDFDAVTGFQAAELRSGRRISARTGVTWHASPTQSFRVEGLFMDKKGAMAFESYDRYGANVQHRWLLGRGAFTLAGVWAEKSDYDGNDAFVSAMVRDEWLYRGRFTAGAPLSFFAPGSQMPDALADINIIAQYEYETVDSNILNFDYDSHKVSLLLSKRFAF